MYSADILSVFRREQHNREVTNVSPDPEGGFRFSALVLFLSFFCLSASGTTAVQIMEKQGWRNVLARHVGSANSEAKLGVLMQATQVELRQMPIVRLHFGAERKMQLDLLIEPSDNGSVL